MSNEKGMSVPEDLLYTHDHEWIKVLDDNGNDKYGLCGITDHAQHSLGDMVFVEFVAAENSNIMEREAVAIVESPKAASDVFSPVKGKITAVNREVEDAPELINRSPYGEGWLFKIEIADKGDLGSLLKPAEYMKLMKEGN
jgi:glycine cleavage system H protein